MNSQTTTNNNILQAKTYYFLISIQELTMKLLCITFILMFQLQNFRKSLHFSYSKYCWILISYKVESITKININYNFIVVRVMLILLTFYHLSQHYFNTEINQDSETLAYYPFPHSNFYIPA